MSFKNSRWEKNKNLNSQILKILKKKREFITTNKISSLLKDNFNINPSHKTINKYLDHLEKNDLIQKQRSGLKNKVRFWRIKPEKI